MSKPYGMDCCLNVIAPTPVENTIYRAVEEAIDAGWTPKRFRDEAAECWELRLRDEIKWAKREFKR